MAMTLSYNGFLQNLQSRGFTSCSTSHLCPPGTRRDFRRLTTAASSHGQRSAASCQLSSVAVTPAATKVRVPGMIDVQQRKPRRMRRLHAAYVPYEYEDEDYVEICTCNAPYGPVNALGQDGSCTILFKQRDAEMSLDTQVLEMFVGGDTARNVCLLANNRTSDRPLMHDLLWQILERGQEISKKEWKIIRVAIVSISEDAFIGRLFFGDTDSDKVVWDCDCRPSDGYWLSLKSGAPLFAHKHVWHAAGKLLRETQTYEVMNRYHRQQTAQFEGLRSAAAMMSTEPSLPPMATPGQPTDPQEIHSIKLNDLEAIKLLKRELQVAIKEEDYPRAIEIRDHPYMKVYAEIENCKKLGNYDEAYDLQAHLQKMIETAENQSGLLDR